MVRGLIFDRHIPLSQVQYSECMISPQGQASRRSLIIKPYPVQSLERALLKATPLTDLLRYSTKQSIFISIGPSSCSICCTLDGAISGRQGRGTAYTCPYATDMLIRTTATWRGCQSRTSSPERQRQADCYTFLLRCLICE